MGFLAGCIDYYSHIFYWAGNTNPIHDLWHNDHEIHADGEYFTELITRYAVDFLQRAARDDTPFFLYVPYNAPHYPLHAPQKYQDRFAGLPPERQIMAAMLSAVDDSVGAILGAVRGAGLEQNTCVFYQSDNGPSRETRNWLDGATEPYRGGSAGPLKGHKFSLYEGGIRVPGLISWPARIPSGQVVNEPGIAMDLFPTFLRAAGADCARYELDGCDILPMLTQHAPSPHNAIYWEYQDQTAVRRGPWKLVLDGKLVENAPDEDAIHLSNLDADPSEALNLKAQEPERAADLTRMAQTWRADLEARWERERKS
jgi:arylsulfatase A-like enzyme